MKTPIGESELILNSDGSIYHLNLFPEDISDIVINVGDPDRVHMVSRFFSSIEIQKQKREFVTHTGFYNNRRITVMSTGIGTDNIDIVYNELDALVNVDLKTRLIKEKLQSLILVRIGTSGALQHDIPVDSFVCATHGLGLDGLINFYKHHNTHEERELLSDFLVHYPNHNVFAQSYITEGDANLIEAVGYDMYKGITASCAGFYGPQGRVIRAAIAREGKIERLSSFKFRGHRITNFEMETSAMYGLARILGHKCVAVNTIVANRITKQFSHNYLACMNSLIETTLNRLSLL